MKREILFKGQLIDTKEWVEGTCHYSNDSKYHYILNKESFLQRTYDSGNEQALKELEVHRVIPETVSQFINQKDKNGKKIFEGDYDADGNCIVWCENCNGFEFAAIDIPTKDICIPCHRCDGNFFFGDQINDFEIVGNVAD